MPNFNLDNYETVETRLDRFLREYPTARVVTEMAEYADDRVVFKAMLFKHYEDELVSATGYAEETRGDGYVNKTSHLENCETSAIGRALANLGYAPMGSRPSREEMQKVARGSESTKSGQDKTVSKSELTDKQITAILKMEAYKQGTLSAEDTKTLKAEIKQHWTKRMASDYIGKKKDLEELRELY